MAGDWIKMRTDLMDDPAVVAIAVRLEMEEDHVVGKLHRIWAWADRHTIDGATSGVNDQWVDRYVAKKGFAAAMVAVGWLAVTDEGITFPAFQKHNGESAKKRADAQQRQRESRQGRHNSVTTSSRDNVPAPFRRAVFTRDKYTCVYCGVESTEIRESEGRKAKLSIDHILPVSRGGMTVIENLATCCRACNSEKTNRTPEEWDLLPTFLQDGVVYENGHIIVTKRGDKTVTREEKRREEVDNAGALSIGVPSAHTETPAKRPRKFVPPTVDEVRAYCQERGNSIDPERFVDTYASQGWKKSNGVAVVDWKGCVRTWEKNDADRRFTGTVTTGARPSQGGAVGGLFSREQQREAANDDAIAGFLQRHGVRGSNSGAIEVEAHRKLHGGGTPRLVCGSAEVSGTGGESGGRGASDVGNAVSGGCRPIPEVSVEDASGVLPESGR